MLYKTTSYNLQKKFDLSDNILFVIIKIII